MYIHFIIPGILLVLSILLLTGRGSWLIAGYNTASPEDKSKYDRKKLTRAAGIMLLIVTGAVLLMMIFQTQLINYVGIAIIIASAIFAIIYMNTKCKKTDYASEKAADAPNRKNVKISVIIAVIVVAVVIGLMVYSNQPTAYSIKNGTFEISTMFGETINLSDINSVQLKSELPSVSERVNGSAIGNMLKGEFSSNLGNVMLFIDSSINSYIYINTNAGFVIINDQSVSKTQDLYNELLSNIKK